MSHTSGLRWLLAGECLADICISINVLESAELLQDMLAFAVTKQAEIDREHKIIQFDVGEYRGDETLSRMAELLDNEFRGICEEMVLFGEPADPQWDITVQIVVQGLHFWIGCYDVSLSFNALGQYQHNTHVRRVDRVLESVASMGGET